jgi:hypothetical protein
MEHAMPPLEKPKELLVFIVRRDTRCAECKAELLHGSFITLEEKGALCLSCADLDHLYFLPSGDAALTRRATKHSRLHAKESDAIVLAVRAHVRHCHTQYDELLSRGYDRYEARELVAPKVENILLAWARAGSETTQP